MNNLIEAITKTRETAENIFTKVLPESLGKSEIEISNNLLLEISNHKELFPYGWYDPPKGGVAVLFDEKPFKRLQFETLRDPFYSPKENYLWEKESVGIVYISPIDKKTNMLGDIGFTVYTGENEEIKNHINECYKLILDIAEHAEVGMKFSDLSTYAKKKYDENHKVQKYTTLLVDPNKSRGINLGHTIPGSYEKNFNFGKSFEEIKEKIRVGRVFVDMTEDFVIPETCAFTIESRLVDSKKEYLPNVQFHFIVTFDKRKKGILNNLESIYKSLRMDYIKI